MIVYSRIKTIFLQKSNFRTMSRAVTINVGKISMCGENLENQLDQSTISTCILKKNQEIYWFLGFIFVLYCFLDVIFPYLSYMSYMTLNKT